jgi:putative transposase
VVIDLGLKVFYADSDGQTVENPRFLRTAERRIKRLQRQVPRKYDKARKKAKQSQSHNYQKAQKKLAKAHLRVQRQREGVARKRASALVRSCDLLADENLQIRNLVRNHRLATSLSDAAWGRFPLWVDYYARLHGVPLVAVPPQDTTQACSGCGRLVWNALSTRTHVCPHCGLILDRDENAARNILTLALELWAQLRGLHGSSHSGSHSSRQAHRTAGQAGTGSG